jgi:hypothetical protein
MLQLFLSIVMMLGMQFNITESGQVSVKGDASVAMEKTRSCQDFEKLGGEPALDAVVILDGTDGKE